MSNIITTTNILSIQNYKLKEFIQVYKREIGIILGILISNCEKNNIKIINKENLFKNMVDIIYIYSDKRKLRYE
jgi:hypothetical protein